MPHVANSANSRTGRALGGKKLHGIEGQRFIRYLAQQPHGVCGCARLGQAEERVIWLSARPSHHRCPPLPGGIRIPIRVLPSTPAATGATTSSSTFARCSDRPGVTQAPHAHRMPFQS